MTLADFLPIPSSNSISYIVPGTLPPNLSTIFLAAIRILLALPLKKPVDLIIFSNSDWEALAKSFALLYFLNSAGVTRLTLSSVHWADSLVATKSCKGFSKINEQRA